MASGESYGVPNQFGGARLGSGLVGLNSIAGHNNIVGVI
jgi:hypothetical protein